MIAAHTPSCSQRGGNRALCRYQASIIGTVSLSSSPGCR
jgi:hypothetical protein